MNQERSSRLSGTVCFPAIKYKAFYGGHLRSRYRWCVASWKRGQIGRFGSAYDSPAKNDSRLIQGFLLGF